VTCVSWTCMCARDDFELRLAHGLHWCLHSWYGVVWRELGYQNMHGVTGHGWTSLLTRYRRCIVALSRICSVSH